MESLKNEFIRQQKEKTNNNTELLFMTSNENYILWLEKKLTDTDQALQLQQTGVSGSVLSGIELVKECAKIIVETQDGSASLLQRRLDLSYNKASRIMDVLEEIKIVDQFSGEKKREVFIKNIEDLIPKLDEINVYNCRFV